MTLRFRIYTVMALVTTGLLHCAGCREKAESSTEPKAVASGQPGGSPQNIVLITLESLRSDHVGCYGYDRDTTPSLDALAKEGTIFERAHSVTSWTLPSHASIFTGLYPTAHKALKSQDRLDDSYTTLAEILGRSGYQTAGIISGPFLRREHNLNQGFEIYDESASSLDDNRAHFDITNPRMEALLLNYLFNQRSGTKPFFLFLYFWDPHYDYIPPPPYDTMFVPEGAEAIDVKDFVRWNVLSRKISPAQKDYVLSQYDGEIRCTDDLLGRLWYRLRELGLWDNTTIIVTADHGEEFYEHNHWGHKNNLYEESLHVPLIIKPAGASRPKRDDRLVNLIDLFPTILELAHATTADPYQGVSLWEPPAKDAVTSFYELLSTNYFTPKGGQRQAAINQWYAVRQGNLKLVSRYSHDEWALYDLNADPHEQSPLGSSYADKLKELRGRLEEFRASMAEVSRGWGTSPPATLSEKELERLRSLGYIDTGGDEKEPND